MIYRLLMMLAVALFSAPLTLAQDFSGLARVDTAHSQITDTRNGLMIELHLSQAIPHRVFTLDSPRRLVLDFREVDWTGARKQTLLNADRATDVHFGPLRPGWSRMVVELQGPMVVTQAGMTVAEDTGAATLVVLLDPTDDATYQARAGAPTQSEWDKLLAQPSSQTPEPQGPLVIMIDPGHGGIDPGAERNGVKEADLMMSLAIELADYLNRSGQIKAVLTRQGDYFVPLQTRMTLAHKAGASALISLHADALEEGDARGASIYTLSATGQSAASARMVERHERGDLVAGLDLAGQGDRVAAVLMDLARLETVPASKQLAEAVLTGMRGAGVRLHPRPLRAGNLAVLNAPDFASILIEAGFLSNDRDRAMLQDANARATLVSGIADGLVAWAIAQEVNAPLIRQ